MCSSDLYNTMTCIVYSTTQDIFINGSFDYGLHFDSEVDEGWANANLIDNITFQWVRTPIKGSMTSNPTDPKKMGSFSTNKISNIQIETGKDFVTAIDIDCIAQFNTIEAMCWDVDEAYKGNIYQLGEHTSDNQLKFPMAWALNYLDKGKNNVLDNMQKKEAISLTDKGIYTLDLMHLDERKQYPIIFKDFAKLFITKASTYSGYKYGGSIEVNWVANAWGNRFPYYNILIMLQEQTFMTSSIKSDDTASSLAIYLRGGGIYRIVDYNMGLNGAPLLVTDTYTDNKLTCAPIDAFATSSIKNGVYANTGIVDINLGSGVGNFL